jgi:hypothetical protein
MKFATITLVGLFAAATPAWADNIADDARDVQADRAAIAKDNAALQKDQEKLARHRAEKANAEARGDYGNQAAASAKIGADQTAIAEKRVEKKADKKILQHHKEELNEDTASPESSTY